MSLTRDEVRELAELLRARAGEPRSEPPKLRLVVPPSPKLLDPIFREQHIKRVLFLQRAYRLQWLVDQACFNGMSLSCLEDCDLIRLLNDMERARECIADGVSFEDAGLVRSLSSEEPPAKDPPRKYRSAIRQAEISEMAAGNLPAVRPMPVGPSKILTDEQPPF